MGRYFAQDSKLASLERLMMTPPNFIPCGGGVMLICTINEMAGTPTLAELAQELIRPWRRLTCCPPALRSGRGHFWQSRREISILTQ